MFDIINANNKIIFNNYLKEKEKEIDVGRDDGYVFKNALYS